MHKNIGHDSFIFYCAVGSYLAVNQELNFINMCQWVVPTTDSSYHFHVVQVKYVPMSLCNTKILSSIIGLQKMLANILKNTY